MREGSECKGAAAARNTRTFLSAGENVRERERERKWKEARNTYAQRASCEYD